MTAASISLSRIVIYPIKSTRGIELESVETEPEGLAGDRRFLITDANGSFVTARKHPRLLQVGTLLGDGTVTVSAPGLTDLILRTGTLENDYVPVTVWRDRIDGQDCGDEASTWFTEFLGFDARLFFLGPASRRAYRDGGPLSFADGAPLLLTSEASAEDLGRRVGRPMDMRRFRPNLVLSGCDAWAEDRWSRIRIGEVALRLDSPCTRCVLTTIDPDSSEPDPDREPLRTLNRFRKSPDGGVLFGRNARVVEPGRMHLGDPVSILD